MARVYSYFVHPNFERDALLRYGKLFGKDGNHFCCGFDRVRDFLAAGSILGSVLLRNLTRTT
jgi:hypothetical protein